MKISYQLLTHITEHVSIAASCNKKIKYDRLFEYYLGED